MQSDNDGKEEYIEYDTPEKALAAYLIFKEGKLNNHGEIQNLTALENKAHNLVERYDTQKFIDYLPYELTPKADDQKKGGEEKQAPLKFQHFKYEKSLDIFKRDYYGQTGTAHSKKIPEAELETMASSNAFLATLNSNEYMITNFRTTKDPWESQLMQALSMYFNQDTQPIGTRPKNFDIIKSYNVPCREARDALMVCLFFERATEIKNITAILSNEDAATEALIEHIEALYKEADRLLQYGEIKLENGQIKLLQPKLPDAPEFQVFLAALNKPASPALPWEEITQDSTQVVPKARSKQPTKDPEWKWQAVLTQRQYDFFSALKKTEIAKAIRFEVVIEKGQYTLKIDDNNTWVFDQYADYTKDKLDSPSEIEDMKKKFGIEQSGKTVDASSQTLEEKSSAGKELYRFDPNSKNRQPTTPPSTKRSNAAS